MANTNCSNCQSPVPSERAGSLLCAACAACLTQAMDGLRLKLVGELAFEARTCPPPRPDRGAEAS
jgi:predicted amidophosphoribosyltransferase